VESLLEKEEVSGDEVLKLIEVAEEPSVAAQP
jgi:hypothetical protein